jgi:G3E family GTPase
MSRPAADYTVLPVIVLTGFLGSGKTTLLQRLLAADPPGDTAVLINEIGDVGIDHQLIRPVAPEVQLLPSGCVCCSIRGELKDALLALFAARQREELPPFKRVILETIGLADPAPILATLANDPQLRHHFCPGRIVTLIDAVHAEFQQIHHPEWLAQAGAADTLVISKTDCVETPALLALRDALEGLNPAADLVYGYAASAAWLTLFAAGPAVTQLRVFKTLTRLGTLAKVHAEVHAASLILEKPLDWTHFGIWLSMLLHAHGDRLLRIKGLLDVGTEAPVVLHGVQHVLNPPTHLAAWPDDDHRSRLVFITRGIPPDVIKASLTRFMAAMAPIKPAAPSS